MTKLQSPCLCSVTFLLLCRATSGKPILVKSDRRSSISGAVYSTNSNPSVPIGFSRPSGPFSATCVAISVSFEAQLRLEEPHFKARCGRLSYRANRGRRNVMEAPEGWSIEEGGAALVRTLRFNDFSEAFAFLTRVALHAEKADHHPEFTSVWNRIDFRLTSHDAGGVTERDVALAEAIDRLVRPTNGVSAKA